ncbi:MAG: hypothetical protein DMG04_17270 [Acidobacteria bacterium]|nr:MAG: hypothetical protein DMG04_17270 [Acidobacteriota bacterium]PYQ78638.1 MAG: hypothetical protein DMG03_27710 [Acidobacteriota bacterium]PYQ88173.1 MAG: hypothetical protein DMG02_18750 [Acidobacteriota bacterium]
MAGVPWHELLAPLPADALPRRQPIAAPEVLARPEAAAIADWQQLIVELSAGSAGLRILLVVLDGSGRPISASDAVLRTETISDIGDDAAVAVRHVHENIGGRFEEDGSFRGTRWRTVSVDTNGGKREIQQSTPSEPSAADAERLKALVDDIVRRGQPETR